MKTLVALLIACGAAVAQWSNVTALSAGTPVTVERKNASAVKGAFVRAAADSVTVSAKSGEATIPRAEIVRVETKSHRYAKWWGLAIGAGSGAVLGGAAHTRITNESGGDLNLGAAVVAGFIAAGALIGLAIGATLDSHHSTIYRGP